MKVEIDTIAPTNRFGATKFQAVFPNVPIEQKYFGAKHNLSTLYTDHAIEKLNSHRQFSDAVEELVENLRLIFTFDHITYMNQFKGQLNKPNGDIETAIRILTMNEELCQSAKKLLKPKVYDLYALGFNDLLNGVAAENALFNKHFPTKAIISETGGKNVMDFTNYDDR